MASNPTLVNSSNISSWFSISDTDGISSWSGNTFTVNGVYSNNRVKLTALCDMFISFDYTTTSFCKISLKGQYICDTGEDGSYTGTLLEGQSFHCYFSNTSSTQTGTFSNITCMKMKKKVCYVGVDGKARQVKKIYVGVNSFARRVKKAYVGVGGIARIWWTTGLEYNGTAPALNPARRNLAATTVGNYALFGGGMTPIRVANVDAYDASLTKHSVTSLSDGREFLAATTVGNYALFGGGRNDNSTVVGTVDAYDTSLTRTLPDTITALWYLSATSNGSYAIFAGGQNNKNTYVRAYSFAYDTSLTKTSSPNMSKARKDLAATTVGNYALFGGGSDLDGKYSNDMYDTVDAYNTSLTLTSGKTLSAKRKCLAATAVGNYALFGGGGTSSTVGTNVVDAFDSSLTRSTPDVLSAVRMDLSATTVGGFAVFGGGGTHNYTATNCNAVDAYDESLVHTIPEHNLSVGRECYAATTVGSYALFGGGWDPINSKYVSTVDVYTA